jgi:hypothetical protein
MARLAWAGDALEEGEVESTTPGVERWLSDLPDGHMDAGRLPTAVHAVAGRALRRAEGSDDPGEVALARVLSRSGTWVVGDGGRVEVDALADDPVAAILELEDRGEGLGFAGGPGADLEPRPVAG